MKVTKETLTAALKSQITQEQSKRIKEVLLNGKPRSLTGGYLTIETIMYYLLKKVNLQQVLIESRLDKELVVWLEGYLYSTDIPSYVKDTVLSDPDSLIDTLCSYIAEQILEIDHAFKNPSSDADNDIFDLGTHNIMQSAAVKYCSVTRGLGLCVDHMIATLLSNISKEEHSTIEILPLAHLYDEIGHTPLDEWVISQLDTLHSLIVEKRVYPTEDNECYQIVRTIKSIRHHWKRLIDIECIGYTSEWSTSVINKCMALFMQPLNRNTHKFPSDKPANTDSLKTLYEQFEYDIIMAASAHGVHHGLELIERAKYKENAQKMLLFVNPRSRKVFLYNYLGYLVKILSAIFIGTSFVLFLNKSLADSTNTAPPISYASSMETLLFLAGLLGTIALNGVILQKQSFADSKKSVMDLLEHESDRILFKVLVIGLFFTAIFYTDPILFTTEFFKYAVYLTCTLSLGTILLEQFGKPRLARSLFASSTAAYTLLYIVSIGFMMYTVLTFGVNDISVQIL